MDERATRHGAAEHGAAEHGAAGRGTPDPGTVVVELTGMTLAERETRLHLLGEHGAVTLAVPMEPPALQAVRHLIALHGHATDCPDAVDFGDGLLYRTVATLGVRAMTLLVRPSQPPAFWLRLWHPQGLRHLDLDVLSACALLLRRRMPVEVEVDRDRAALGGRS